MTPDPLAPSRNGVCREGAEGASHDFEREHRLLSQSDEPAGEIARRTFLARATGILTLPLTLVIATPLVGSLVGPIYRKAKARFASVPGFEGVSIGEPADLRFPYTKTDAYLVEHVVEDAWVIKHSATSATVFSPICPHMGCRYEWDGGTQQFVCPCHGSVFSITGEVLAGPAPRPLDTLPYKIENGALEVKWERFEPGIAKKVRMG